jgi:DNA-binding response OmpR family regulator
MFSSMNSEPCSLLSAPALDTAWIDNLRCRILFTDDDEDICRFHAEALTRLGHHVDTAADGAAAWEALTTNCHDLLITDNKMPKVTGLELLEKVRGARMALPIIMATGTLPTEAFARRPWLTPEGTLLKPYTLPELLQTVKSVLHASAGNPEGQGEVERSTDFL